MLQVLAISATVVTMVGVAILAYPIVVPEEERARRRRHRWLRERAEAFGLRGMFSTYPTGWGPGVIMSESKYEPADEEDRLLYAKVSPNWDAYSKDLLVLMFWTNRNIGLIGVSVAIVGGALAIIAAVA